MLEKTREILNENNISLSNVMLFVESEFHNNDKLDILNQIDFIKLPENWSIKPIYNSVGSALRFIIKTDKNQKISVYFDVFKHLGNSENYYEVMIDVYNIERFSIIDNKDIIKEVKTMLNNRYYPE